MRVAWLKFSLLVCLLAHGAEAPPPAMNWVLPIFTDKEGYRSLTARGSEVRPLGNDSVTVTDLNITVFSGDAASQVETVFLSPLANFNRNAKRADGDQSVRIVRDDLEATGKKWTYDHGQKRVTLQGKVRITFNAEIKDLLK